MVGDVLSSQGGCLQALFAFPPRGCAGALAALSGPALAVPLIFVGFLETDDDLAVRGFAVPGRLIVAIQTYGYSGGVTRSGAIAQAGGFDPILSLFDSSSTILAVDDDDRATATPDPVTAAGSTASSKARSRSAPTRSP